MSKEQVVERAVSAVKCASQKFLIIQWSAEDTCRTELPFLAEIIEEVIQAGANVINIPDTVGYINPYEYVNIFNILKSFFN